VAKKDKSAIVSGAGFLASFWLAFERAVKEHGGTEEDLHRLGTEDGRETIRQMAELAVAVGKPAEEEEDELQRLTVTVNYIPPLEAGEDPEEFDLLQAMIAEGNYDWVNSDITSEHFPIEGEGQVEVELHLIHLNRVATGDEVLTELDKRNLRPATIEDLLALGAIHPDLQRDFPIVAVGSVWRRPDGHRYVPCLCGHWDGRRDLGLDWIGFRWDGDCRFLAVGK